MKVQCQACMRESDVSGVSGEEIPWRCPTCHARHTLSASFNLLSGLRLLDRYTLPPDLKCSLEVLRDLKEAARCYNAYAPRAAAVMVRLALERTCIELGAAGNTLHAKIEDLADRGIFDKVLVQGATAMRLFGNAGAHPKDDLLDEKGELVEYSLKMAVDLLGKAKR